MGGRLVGTKVDGRVDDQGLRDDRARTDVAVAAIPPINAGKASLREYEKRGGATAPITTPAALGRHTGGACLKFARAENCGGDGDHSMDSHEGMICGGALKGQSTMSGCCQGR